MDRITAELTREEYLGVLITRRGVLTGQVDQVNSEIARLGGEATSAPPRPAAPMRSGRKVKTPKARAPKIKGAKGDCMKDHIRKLIEGKRGQPLVTREIVDQLREAYPDAYGPVEPDVLGPRVSACLTHYKEIFKCLGRGEGYVLTDEAKAMQAS